MTLVDIVFRLNAIASPYFHHIRLAFAYKVNLLASSARVRSLRFMDLRRKVAGGEAGGRFVITTSDWPGRALRSCQGNVPPATRYFHLDVAHFFYSTLYAIRITASRPDT